MSDITCAKCGEPWDAYGVRHGDMDDEEAERFLNGEGCPCCGFGTKCNGTGRFSPLRSRIAERENAFMSSALDATDDPDELLERWG